MNLQEYYLENTENMGRCDRCGKISYNKKQVMEIINQVPGHAKRYRCPYNQQYFHLTSQKRRRKWRK